MSCHHDHRHVMLSQHNKVDLENNQEMEQENAVKLPWINLSLAPCCAEMPAMALLFHTARQRALGAGGRRAVSVIRMVQLYFPPTAPALLHNWEIWSNCCREQLLLLALLKVLPLKSIRLDPHPDQSPEVTGTCATEKLLSLTRLLILV